MSEVKQKDIAVAPKAEITPMDMLNMAVQQNADLDKLEKLMALQERWENNQAKKAYVAAMANFRAKCPMLDKDQQGHNSKFAGLATSIETIKGLMKNNGLSHNWKTAQDGNQVSVTCCVTHIGGHSECTTLTAGPDTSGSKNAVQAIGSTVKYLQRYTFESILGLASKEMDDDGAGAGGKPTLTEEQVNTLHSEATEAGVYEAFIGWVKGSLKVNSLDQIHADKYELVKSNLDKAVNSRAKK